MYTMKDQSDDPLYHEKMLYHKATSCSSWLCVKSSPTLERDVPLWLSICSWCDGSSVLSLMVDPLKHYLFQPVLHNLCNKDCGMCYPVCGIVHIKEPLLLIRKSSLCGDSRFPRYLNGPLPYIRRHITVNKMY